ncbi:calumenin-B, partial [Elysia marginata]
LIQDDEARFNVADQNKDGSLDAAEYMAFFQPYDFPHMFEVEMAKTMKDFDKDKDGFVSKQEFIGDIFSLFIPHSFLRTIAEETSD